MIERYNAIAIRGRANFNSISSCSLASDKYTNRKFRLYGVADDAALNGILFESESERRNSISEKVQYDSDTKSETKRVEKVI